MLLRSAFLLCLTHLVLTPGTSVASPIEDSLKIPVLLRTHELFEKPVYDMARSRQGSGFVVSAGGVYRKTEGDKWEQIPRFKKANHPVAYDEDGTLYVGAYRSFDGGLSFEGYIKWDSVLRAVRSVSNRAPRQVRLEKIIPKRNRIVIQVDAGWDELLLLATPDGGETWSFEAFEGRDAFVLERETLASLDRRKSSPKSQSEEGPPPKLDDAKIRR